VRIDIDLDGVCYDFGLHLRRYLVPYDDGRNRVADLGEFAHVVLNIVGQG
jgi:hypothetical protein